MPLPLVPYPRLLRLGAGVACCDLNVPADGTLTCGDGDEAADSGGA